MDLRRILIISGLALICTIATAQEVVRGPYLQSPGKNSMIIRWRTDLPTNSRVMYGTDLEAPMPFAADEAAMTTEHRVQLTGLAVNTTYYYTVGNTDNVVMGPMESMRFTTAPDESGAVRIWAIGDFGHGNLAQREVRDSYLDYAEDHPADLWLWLGDNVYQDGTDQEYQDKVFDDYYGYGDMFHYLPFASTSGNHDYNSICPWQNPDGIPVLCNTDPYLHTGPYLDIIDPPTQGELGGVPSGLKLYYSFDYGDIHFVSLNSELGSWNSDYNWIGMFNNSTQFTSPMLDWLRADLASTTKKWKIVFWHQCPYSGQLNFTEEASVQQFCVATRHHFNPIIEEFGADLVLTGHDHNYQRSYLINGHYYGKSSFTADMMIDGGSGKESEGEAYVKYTNGPEAGKGTVYVLQGNSSGGNAYSPIVHPAIYWGQACDTCWGSFILDVDGDRLDGRYLTSAGTILDEFTIIKEELATGLANGIIDPVNLGVFPNPTAGSSVIEYHSPAHNSALQMDLLTPAGKSIFSVSGTSDSNGLFRSSIDLKHAGIPAGTYMVRINDNGSICQKKLVLMY